jgi:hypothetical protein
MSFSKKGKFNGEIAVGKSFSKSGYVYLTMQYDHPLATKGAVVPEHRFVLYQEIGDGPHPCFECRKLLLWNGMRKYDCIYVDHINEKRNDNRVANLRVSCLSCNIHRGRR